MMREVGERSPKLGLRSQRKSYAAANMSEFRLTPAGPRAKSTGTLNHPMPIL